MAQCFAYSTTLQRCELDGGHDGNHSVSMSWTDDECYQPTTQAAVPVPFPFTGTMPVSAGDDDAYDPEKGCAGCEHAEDMHLLDGCQMPECSCYAFI